jgi:hypothetical protein
VRCANSHPREAWRTAARRLGLVWASVREVLGSDWVFFDDPSASDWFSLTTRARQTRWFLMIRACDKEILTWTTHSHPPSVAWWTSALNFCNRWQSRESRRCLAGVLRSS